MQSGEESPHPHPSVPRSKFALLLALYFVQGLPFGFQAKALPIYLREQGVGLTEIGLLGALALPWMLKALWAPLVDRYGSARVGRRKSWIVPMQGGLLVTCLGAALAAQSGHLTLLLWLILLMNFFAATQDIAVDALAVDILGQRDLGPGNAAQVVGYKMGMLTGGGLLVWATASLGWEMLFYTMALLIGAVLLWVILFREQDHGAASSPRVTLKEVISTLRQISAKPHTRWVLAVVATYKLGESMSDRMFLPFVQDHGIPPETLGLWMGVYGMGASIAGSLMGGYLAYKQPLIRALTWTATIRVVPLIGQWVLSQTDPSSQAIIGVTLAEHFFGGALTTVLFAFMMSQVEPRVAATHFTILATLEVLGKSPGSLGSGYLADAFDYGTVFAIGALFSILFLLLLPPLKRALTVSDNLPS